MGRCAIPSIIADSLQRISELWELKFPRPMWRAPTGLRYAPSDSERWSEESSHLPVDVILVGHSHTRFIKKVGNCLIVNPGSLGQPDNRSGLACYAVWEAGAVIRERGMGCGDKNQTVNRSTNNVP
jgi:Calcineurin-like phosphoesterase superfamily domain